jgi:hypothetical protein
MPDSTTAAQGDSSSAGITNEQLAQQVADLAGSVSSLNEKLLSISESVNKIQTESGTDSDSGYVVRSTIDPASAQRRQDSYAEIALSNALSFQSAMNALMVRKVSQDTDHHASTPPMAPRSASGPGTSGS